MEGEVQQHHEMIFSASYNTTETQQFTQVAYKLLL